MSKARVLWPGARSAAGRRVHHVEAAAGVLAVNQAGGNFRLLPASFCINAGSNNPASGTRDLDGNPRIAHGTVDFGASDAPGTAPPASRPN